MSEPNLSTIQAVLKYFKAPRLEDDDIQPAKMYFHLKMILEQDPKLVIFLGKSEEQKALVRQWVDFYTSITVFNNNKTLSELDTALTNYTFFAGHTITLCDILFYFSLYSTYKTMSFEDKELYANLSRWFSLIQEDSELRQGNKQIQFHRTPLYF